jgi:GxxExxY protein
MSSAITKKFLDDLTYEIIGSAIEVHRTMGRGLMESVYHMCMKEELLNRKISFHSEFKIPVKYKKTPIDIDFRCDLFVENCIVVELKAVTVMNVLFEAQLLTYMKLLKAPKGVLFNFHSSNIFKEGQKTYVNEFFKLLS